MPQQPTHIPTLPVRVEGKNEDSFLVDASGRAVVNQSHGFKDKHRKMLKWLAGLINASSPEKFTEATLKTGGWYFFYPAHPETSGRPKYIEVDQDAINGKYLQCRMYAGTYIGPITPPKK